MDLAKLFPAATNLTYRVCLRQLIYFENFLQGISWVYLNGVLSYFRVVKLQSSNKWLHAVALQIAISALHMLDAKYNYHVRSYLQP